MRYTSWNRRLGSKQFMKKRKALTLVGVFFGWKVLPWWKGFVGKVVVSVLEITTFVSLNWGKGKVIENWRRNLLQIDFQLCYLSEKLYQFDDSWYHLKIVTMKNKKR